MKSVIALAAVGVVVFSVAAAAEEARKVVVASDGAYPPFDITLPDGTLSGYSVEVARAICDSQPGMDCTFVKMEFAGMIPALVSGNIDMTGLTISEERKKSVDFAMPIFRSPVTFVGRKGMSVDPADLASFDGIKLGVESGSIMECFVDKHLQGVDKTVYQAQADALLDLESGRIDLLIGEGLQISEAFLVDRPEYAIIGEPLTSADCFGPGTSYALRHGEDALTAMVNAGIHEIHENGTLKAINDRYFDIDISVVE